MESESLKLDTENVSNLPVVVVYLFKNVSSIHMANNADGRLPEISLTCVSLSVGDSIWIPTFDVLNFLKLSNIRI